MTNVYDMSPDASDDEDFQTLAIEEFEPFKDLQTLLNRPAHLSIFLNYAIGENRPNNLVSFLLNYHDSPCPDHDGKRIFLFPLDSSLPIYIHSICRTDNCF